MSETFEKTDLNRVRRAPKRGGYDKQTVYDIVDEALICHLGFVQEGQPFVIPTIHARIDDQLYLHGSSASRMLKHGLAGEHFCATITHIDGLVMARSIFHHSMNYRSAVIFGQARAITDPAEKMAALEAFSEKLIPGRWDDCRQPNEIEIKATAVVALSIDAASSKIRAGDPIDDEDDYALPYWAGVIPMRTVMDDPVDDERLTAGIELPEYIQAYVDDHR